MKESNNYQSYYTKSDYILDYMVSKLHIKPCDHVLEPCGGDGAFVDKILDIHPSVKIDVFELNPSAIKILYQKYKNNCNVSIKETDTLLDDVIINKKQKYDVIIGNPPYGARNDENKKEILNRLYPDLYTKESYTLFLYACIMCLKEEGELCFIVPDTFLSLHRHLSIRRYILVNTQIKEIALFPSSFFPGINFGYANLCIISIKRSSNITQNLNNNIVIRTNFKSVVDLNNQTDMKCKEVSQKQVLESVSSAFMFNSSDKISRLINDDSIYKIGDIAYCVTGFYSGDDKVFLHPANAGVKNAKRYTLAEPALIHKEDLTNSEKLNGIDSSDCLIPIVKGGNIEYLKPNNWYMDWSKDAVRKYRDSKKCRFQNSNYYFQNGIGIPMVRSSKLTGALIGGRLFDQSIVGVFPKDNSLIKYLLGFFNSSICTELINAINPSTNNSANYIKKIPFVMPDDKTKYEIENLVESIIVELKQGNNNIDNYKQLIDERISMLYYENAGTKKDKRKKEYKVKQLNFIDLF